MNKYFLIQLLFLQVQQFCKRIPPFPSIVINIVANTSHNNGNHQEPSSNIVPMHQRNQVFIPPQDDSPTNPPTSTVTTSKTNYQPVIVPIEDNTVYSTTNSKQNPTPSKSVSSSRSNESNTVNSKQQSKMNSNKTNPEESQDTRKTSNTSIASNQSQDSKRMTTTTAAANSISVTLNAQKIYDDLQRCKHSMELLEALRVTAQLPVSYNAILEIFY